MKELLSLSKNNTPEIEKIESPQQGKKEQEKTHHLDLYATSHEVDDPEKWDAEEFKRNMIEQKVRGIDYIAYDWSWTRINPEVGKFDEKQIECYKQAKQIMEEVGLKPPTIIFTVAPEYVKKLYQSGDKEKFFNSYESYIAKVKNALTQCGGKKIETFQIFNELNNKMYTFVKPEDLPRMCEITREVFKDYNPDMKLKATLVAGSLAETVAKFNQAVEIKKYLKDNKEILEKNFDKLAIDYYPGVWHWPLKQAGIKLIDFIFNRNKTKAIFKQTDLLEEVFKEVSGWKTKYEIGEYGLPTNEPWSNEKKQRYAFDVFAKSLRRVLKRMREEGQDLPEAWGIYESRNRLPRNEGEIKMKKRTKNLWPEHDFGITKGNGSPKEIVKGKRGRYTEEERKNQTPQLAILKKYLNRPF